MKCGKAVKNYTSTLAVGAVFSTSTGDLVADCIPPLSLTKGRHTHAHTPAILVRPVVYEGNPMACHLGEKTHIKPRYMLQGQDSEHRPAWRSL